MKTWGPAGPNEHFFLKVEHCHGQTSRFDNEIGFFQEFFLKNHLSRAYRLFMVSLTDWAGKF